MLKLARNKSIQDQAAKLGAVLGKANEPKRLSAVEVAEDSDEKMHITLEALALLPSWALPELVERIMLAGDSPIAIRRLLIRDLVIDGSTIRDTCLKSMKVAKW